MIKLFLFLSFFLVFVSGALAQENRTLTFEISEADRNILSQYHFKTDPSDSLAAVRNLKELLYSLHSDGYLTASIENINFKEDTIKINLEIGATYNWVNLRKGNINDLLLNKIGYRQRFFQDKTFRYHEVSRLLKKIISYSENHGYPFASVKLDSINIKENYIEAAFNYDKGPFIVFDSVNIEGETKTKARFLGNYLRIKPGEPYEEKKVASAENKLSRLPYLSVTAPPYVTFQNSESTTYFGLADKKSNQLDGIIGLLPNESEGNGVLITGEFNLLLQNMFGSGKRIQFEWQRLKENSQLLNAGYFHPNLLGSPLNGEVKFNLLKEDTTFINRAFELEFSYLLGSYSNLQVYGNFKASRLISASQYEEAATLPDFADFDFNSYGARYSWSNLDDYMAPKKGVTFQLECGIGNKKILKNANLSENLYDSVELSNVQYHFKGDIASYLRVAKRVVLKGQLNGGMIVNDRLFFNDLYRLGGLNSVRGFVENEFFASKYAIVTLEPQFFIDDESYVFLFFDQSYISYDLNNRYFKDYPSGAGAGLNFATNAGIFSFVYALGRTEQQVFNFNLSKIHFGYITRF